MTKFNGALIRCHPLRGKRRSQFLTERKFYGSFFTLNKRDVYRQRAFQIRANTSVCVFRKFDAYAQVSIQVFKGIMVDVPVHCVVINSLRLNFDTQELVSSKIHSQIDTSIRVTARFKKCMFTGIFVIHYDNRLIDTTQVIYKVLLNEEHQILI